jgi:uncharacterized protein involved in response to NO
MSALLTRIETSAGNPNSIAAREIRLSRLLTVYIATGLMFMLFPGAFLGVWNLLAISSHRAPGSVSAAWVQAHGHAQIFGWIGTFILGIGYYSIPKLRRLDRVALSAAWTTWAAWTFGATLRWFAGVYQWQWRTLLPVSAALELIGFLIFFRSVSRHRPEASDKRSLDKWVLVVIAGASGWLLALLINFGAACVLAVDGSAPVLPSAFDQRVLVVETWGFLVPFVWGFSAKWLPVFLGLRPVRGRRLVFATAVNFAGVLAELAGWTTAAALLLIAGLAMAIGALRLFQRSERPAKVSGVHASFPVFVRLAYVWAVVAAALGIWSASSANSLGIGGASRHALTVGFLATMVFAIGQRVLPAFSGMRLLFSTRLMFIALLFLTVGCLLRVGFEILAYQDFLRSAWAWLPVSAIFEMAAVTAFASNLILTFARRPKTQ